MYQLRKISPCSVPGKTALLSSIDRLIGLTAAFFHLPLAAIFIRSEHRLLLNIGNDADGSISSEILKVCSVSIDDCAFLVAGDLNHQDEACLHPDLGTFSHLRFCASSPLEAPNGQPIGALCIADVEAKSDFSETDIEQLQSFSAVATDLLVSRMAERNRRASASALAALGHDIRSPMNVVIGMAVLLIASKDLGDKHRQRAQMIKRSGATLLSMIEPVFDIAKIDAEEPSLASQDIDLETFVVREFQACQSKLINKQSDLQLTCDLPNNVDVLVDSVTFKRLLALFFTGSAALNTDETIKYSAVAKTAANKVNVTLSARDIMVEEDQLTCLESLLSTDEDPTVSTLGALGLKFLACRHLAEIMGGSVVVCRLDSCSTRLDIHVHLHLVPSAAATIDASPGESFASDEDTIDVGDLDVLVAEDDPDMALLIEDFLGDAGHRVTIAPSGADVMKILDEKTVDIILMDGQLSDVSGLDVAKSIRNLPDGRAMLPIIALTGDVLAGDRERYMSSGMNDYLPKPVESEQLIDMINHHCALSRQTQPSKTD
ncbi:MAG: response regulator [Pseudomonadota bacterium]